jgi:chemotaxis protein MotB
MILQRSKKEKAAEAHLWQPFSDLFSNLMFIFILAMGAIAFQLRQSQSELKAKQEEIDQSITAIKRKREEIIQRMINAFSSEDKNKVYVDSLTGALKFPGEALFSRNSSILNPASKDIFKLAVDRYFEVLLDTAYLDFIQTIEIEGHTDSDPIAYADPYTGNLKLSQERAFNIMVELLQIRASDTSYLRQKVSASGYSFSRLIVDAQNRENKNKSRRIEIKFRMNETKLLAALERLVKTKD